MADKFRKVSCLNVYGRKRGRVGVKQCMHSLHSLDCLLSVFFDDIYITLEISLTISKSFFSNANVSKKGDISRCLKADFHSGK